MKLWYNGKQDYYTGLALLRRAHQDKELIKLLSTGKSEFNVDRLKKEIEIIISDQPYQEPSSEKKEIPSTIKLPIAPVNEDLYNAAHHAAILKYKEAMNIRAELFAFARLDDWEVVNSPDKIALRSSLAVSAVITYNEASKLFSDADYCKQHGRLPTDNTEEVSNEYADLPDHQVKRALDNLRKNLNKLVVKEQTPERIALVQKHKTNVKILEQKWESLRSLIS